MDAAGGITPALAEHIRIDPCRHGLFASFTGDIYVGKSLATYGEWCESEVSLFSSILRPDDVVIEAGANIGAHTAPIARMVGPKGRVIAIEPQPSVHQMLATNLVLNGVDNVTSLTAAVGAQAGSLDMPEIIYANTYNYGGISVPFLREHGKGRTVRVPVTPLDDLVGLSRLRLIKADVEGMEADLITGAHGLIREFRPALYLENDNPDDTDAILSAMAPFDYQAHWHLSWLFARDNWRGVAENIFETVVCINILLTPKGANVRNLTPVTGPDNHPKRKK